MKTVASFSNMPYVCVGNRRNTQVTAFDRRIILSFFPVNNFPSDPRLSCAIIHPVFGQAIEHTYAFMYSRGPKSYLMADLRQNFTRIRHCLKIVCFGFDPVCLKFQALPCTCLGLATTLIKVSRFKVRCCENTKVDCRQ
jgi:hypothetical protein